MQQELLQKGGILARLYRSHTEADRKTFVGCRQKVFVLIQIHRDFLYYAVFVNFIASGGETRQTRDVPAPLRVDRGPDDAEP
jgi:hypothetical protein